MILELIATLGLTILFTETPRIDCHHNDVNGCVHIEKKIIYLNYRSSDLDRTLWHEIGHSIFWKNEKTKNIIKHYPALMSEESQVWYILNYSHIPDILLEERIANYFAEYKVNNGEFSVKHPCLYIYFKDTEIGLLKKE